MSRIRLFPILVLCFVLQASNIIAQHDDDDEYCDAVDEAAKAQHCYWSRIIAITGTCGPATEMTCDGAQVEEAAAEHPCEQSDIVLFS